MEAKFKAPSHSEVVRAALRVVERRTRTERIGFLGEPREHVDLAEITERMNAQLRGSNRMKVNGVPIHPETPKGNGHTEDLGPKPLGGLRVVPGTGLSETTTQRKPQRAWGN